MTTKERHTILVMESQKRHPEKHLARKAVGKKVKQRIIPSAREFLCFDCNKKAECYDHPRGYEGKYRFDIEPVCRVCHIKRGVKRKEYRNGSMIIKTNSKVGK